MNQKIVCPWMAQKAGMDAIDKDTIKKKIEEITRGSNKSLHEKELEQKRQIQINQMKRKINQLQNHNEKQIINQYTKNKITAIQTTRDLTKVWAHFDYDMFYVACQLLDKPQLNQKPCGVGSQDGVLCTANYVARKYGVRSALPTFIARQLCPDLILIKPDFEKYQKYSKIFRQILSQYDQNLESMGLDQAYIDLTESVNGMSTQQIQIFIKNLRTRIFQATKLTVSCGVGANKLLCKMASQQRKPNNQFILPNQRQTILKFMADKPIRKIPGIGPVNELFLKGIGINTAKQILQKINYIHINFTQLATQSFIYSALGIGRNTHQNKDRKSVSRSETFRPTDSEKQIQQKLKQLVQRIYQDLKELQLLTLNITLSYQTEKFEKRDKCRRLDQYTNNGKAILQVAQQLIKEAKFPSKIRLLGIRCSQLIDEKEFKKNSLENYITEVLKKKQVIEIGNVTQKSVRDPEKPVGWFDCPICNKCIDCKGNNTLFNKHIDKCLQNGANTDNQNQIATERSQGGAVKKKINLVQIKKTKGGQGKLNFCKK